MADVITRLKLESGEYDSKIKRAAQGLLMMEQECRKVGGTLAVLEKDQQDFVRGLGQMETVSRSARGKVSELTSAFTDLSVQYKHLTDEEKNGDYGKALSASLDQLKKRIGEAKEELKDVGKEMEDDSKSGESFGGVVDALAGKFGLSTKALGVWGAALAAGTVAIDTVKGAIESTEATHDTFAKTMAVADNVTNQFLRTLATADFSTFISGLQGIINKTTQAYEAMDEFESYAARFQPWQQAKEIEIQTKLQEARAAKAQGDKQKAEQLIKEAKTLIDQLAASTKAYGEKQTKGGFATIRSLMGGVDISDQQIAWYADPKNWEQAKQKAQKFANIQERIKELMMDTYRNPFPGETAMDYTQRVVTAQMKKNRLEEMLRRDPSLKRAYTIQNLRDSGDSEEAQAFQQALGNIYGNILAKSRIKSLRARADRMEGSVALTSGGATKTTGGGTDSPQQWQFITPSESLLGMVNVAGRSRQDVQDDLNMWKKKYMTATDVEGRTNAKNMQKKYEGELAFMDREENPFAEAYKFDFAKNLDVKPADELAAAGEGVKESWQDAASAIQAVGGALAGLDDPGAKIVGTVGAAIAQIALGFAQATAASSGAGVFGWIAAVAGGLTTMLSTISAIHSATGYASGGIVDGPSGIDKVPAMLTAGEVVLNHAQQNNLAAELSGNRLQGLNLTSRISGEDIILSLNNRSNRMGKGEYVTSKSRRYGS